MSKSNPLGLLVNYGDSDDSDDESSVSKKGQSAPVPNNAANHASAAIHPPPISHCPWSACYDENSGFTYYWNQQTNAVTWEAPPEYLLALKLAQQQLCTSGSAEVSAEEWQLYQQALAEKQNASKIAKSPSVKSVKKNEKSSKEDRGKKNSKKRPSSDSEEDYKIELITSYYNSDSESNDEQDPKEEKKPKSEAPKPKPPAQKQPLKKQKTKPVEYGPSLPENQSYSTPIGPELPPVSGVEKSKSPEPPSLSLVKEEEAKLTPKSIKSDEDSQDESELLKKLKDKALLLEKLGGEIPSELQKIIKEETSTDSPKSAKDLDIDELLQEIEKKELPKAKSKPKIDALDDKKSATDSPRSLTPSLEEIEHKNGPLFPSAVNISEAEKPPEKEKKKNIYLTEVPEVERRKLRISTSVLPRKERVEVPAYTTKYSQFIEGFSSERTGLGFSKEETNDSPKSTSNTINYGNGLMFTKGEVLNEDKKDEALDDMSDLVEAKLKYLMQVQPGPLTAVQEMMIQMQTLVSAFRAGALAAAYWRRWVEAAADALAAHERAAAPPGWHCAFQSRGRLCSLYIYRSEGRYWYRREADGFVQYEYPAVASTDMEICTTPPPDVKEEPAPPPPPPSSPPRVATPPPPAWHDPPPPGTDEAPPLPPEPKKEIGDELLSFYNDIAELEKHSSGPNTAANSPEHKEIDREKEKQKPKEEKEKIEKTEKAEKVEKDKSRRKSKVKISSSIGMKQRTVSSLVAKWQQVAEEISSD